jgi:MFS family permease
MGRRRSPAASRLAVNWGALSVYLLGVFLGALDTNVIAPVFPLIERGFHISLAWTAWTVTAYTVAYAASTVLSGAWGDRVGHARLFRWGLVAFGVASVLAALSPIFAVFVLARVIQGAGAGAVYPNAQAEGLHLFPLERRGTALGLFGAAFGLAAIVGPVVGGLLGQYLGWPAVFWLNAPLALVILWVARKAGSGSAATRAVPDAWGGAGFAGFLAAALLFLMVGGPMRWAVLAAALILLGVFLRRQHQAAVPFLDSRPLSRGSGIALMIGAALIGLDMSAVVFVPTLAQRDLALSVFASGVILLPAALSGAVMAGVAGVAVDRVGARRLIIAGLLAAAAGGVLLAWPHLTMTRFLLAMVVLGLATAFTMGAPLNRIGLALYREDQTAQALALMAVFRSIGLAAGPILLTLATRIHGFTGMFGLVAVASMVGATLFVFTPETPVEVRPA